MSQTALLRDQGERDLLPAQAVLGRGLPSEAARHLYEVDWRTYATRSPNATCAKLGRLHQIMPQRS